MILFELLRPGVVTKKEKKKKKKLENSLTLDIPGQLRRRKYALWLLL